jgi:outer membrane protein assembly factor BamB
VGVRSGRLAWTIPTKGKIYSSPFGDFGHVFIGSDDHNLYAIHLGGGRSSWTYQADGALRTRPLLHESMLLFACQMGIVYALSLSREVKWRFRARRGFLSSPVANKGLVFIGSLDWNFYALDIRSGWAAWRYRTGGPIVSTPVVWEGLVFFGSADGYIYALDADAGRLVWRYQVQGQVTASPTVHGGSVYIGSVEGMLYCLDARTGDLRWQYGVDGPITAAPVVVGGVVFCGSLDHYVYAIPA